MENTSKALLIAAAVLIVILLITIAIRIVGSTGNVTDDSERVGQEINSEIKDTTKDTISSLKDTTSRNLINIPNERFKKENSWYSITRTRFFVEPNKEYVLQFDYKIYDAQYTVYCSVGVIYNGRGPDYNLDLKYSDYPNQKEGTCINKFDTKKITEPLELGIRFARMSHPGRFDVYISNVELREVK